MASMQCPDSSRPARSSAYLLTSAIGHEQSVKRVVQVAQTQTSVLLRLRVVYHRISSSARSRIGSGMVMAKVLGGLSEESKISYH